MASIKCVSRRVALAGLGLLIGRGMGGAGTLDAATLPPGYLKIDLRAFKGIAVVGRNKEPFYLEAEDIEDALAEFRPACPEVK